MQERRPRFRATTCSRWAGGPPTCRSGAPAFGRQPAQDGRAGLLHV